MIAGKTHDEILSLNCDQRYCWYKTILLDEKEKAMKIVGIARGAKISAAMIEYWRYPENKVRINGENNPMSNPDVKAKHKKAMNRPERRKKHSEDMTGRTHSEKSKAKIGAAQTGEDNHNWLGGISFEPYPPKFNDRLKRQIRERDNHTCQECLCTEEQLGRALDVHHIDYDKKNNCPENLIALCQSCHSQTGFGREDWIEYFGRIMEVPRFE